MVEPPNEDRDTSAPSHNGSGFLHQICVVLARDLGRQDSEPMVGATGVEDPVDVQVSRDEVDPERADRPPHTVRRPGLNPCIAHPPSHLLPLPCGPAAR